MVAWNQIRGKREGQASQWQILFLCHTVFLSGLLPDSATTNWTDLPASIKAIRTVLLNLPIQAILICSKLTLKQTIMTSTLVKYRIKFVCILCLHIAYCISEKQIMYFLLIKAVALDVFYFKQLWHCALHPYWLLLQTGLISTSGCMSP